MTDTYAATRKQLLLRSRYRGFKEADILFGRFAERYLADLDADELSAYDALLDEADQDVYGWVMGRIPLPERHNNTVFHRLKDPEITIK